MPLRSHLRDPLVHQSCWAHDPQKGWRHCSSVLWIVFKKAKQTLRFCTRHRSKTPIACLLEPGEDVRTTVLSQLKRGTARRKKPNSSCDHVLERHVSARIIQSFCLNRCGALGPTAVGDDPISEQKDTHVKKSRRLAFSVQDSFLIHNTVNRYCSKTLDCPTAVGNKEKETKGENLTALPATCYNLRYRREKKKSRCAGQHTNRRWCLILRTKTVHRKTGATGSRDCTRT